MLSISVKNLHSVSTQLNLSSNFHNKVGSRVDFVSSVGGIFVQFFEKTNEESLAEGNYSRKGEGARAAKERGLQAKSCLSEAFTIFYEFLKRHNPIMKL